MIKLRLSLIHFAFITAALIAVGIGISVYFAAPFKTDEGMTLNIYNWYGMIPKDVIDKFEAETGISIRYDLYDNNEILEAKLFSGNSGYDVVFPSASPYVGRQIEAGVYQKLDKALLPNLKNMDPVIYEKMRLADPNLEFTVPFYWGTFGFAYVEEEILKRLPTAPVHSYQLLFDPEIVSKFADCGVTLLDESVDVYPAMLTYLGKDPGSNSQEDLEYAQHNLVKIRSFIKRFSSSRFVNELVGGESCLAQAWSGEAQLAQDRANEVGKNIHIRYVVPEEGGTLWIDAMAIPAGAPHPKNAHKFIDFLMDPKNSARISNAIKLAVANKAAIPYIEDKIKSDPTIYPKPAMMAKLKLDKPQNLTYDRHRTRLWTQFRLGKN
ncbi:extracellular solute-binding protein [Candidatus Odyssella acanthamoebae]|uniref:extracellular solute-binding protein n=1 Tax=Candidatus Odyssella acanthamoebae TaxID=91604 RepID=UPI00068BBF68|nr:extracellular solute-binding protein [Candidatus Paracaedibacter acanthamoebae]